jgi:hypothetical protein
VHRLRLPTRWRGDPSKRKRRHSALICVCFVSPPAKARPFRMQREARISFQRPFWNDQSELFFWIALLVVQGSRTFLSYLNVRADWRPVPVTSSPDAQTLTYPAKRALIGIKRTQRSRKVLKTKPYMKLTEWSRLQVYAAVTLGVRIFTPRLRLSMWPARLVATASEGSLNQPAQSAGRWRLSLV